MSDKTVEMEEAEDVFMAWLKSGFYSVDSQGHIWRHYNRKGKGRWSEPERVDRKDTKGYMHYQTHYNGKQMVVYVHRIVYRLHNGVIPVGYEINHIDHNKANNDPTNLEITTHTQNIKHGYGLKYQSDRYPTITPNTTLEEKKAIAIAVLWDSGLFSRPDMALVMSTNKSAIHNAMCRVRRVKND